MFEIEKDKIQIYNTTQILNFFLLVNILIIFVYVIMNVYIDLYDISFYFNFIEIFIISICFISLKYYLFFTFSICFLYIFGYTIYLLININNPFFGLLEIIILFNIYIILFSFRYIYLRLHLSTSNLSILINDWHPTNNFYYYY